MTGGSTSTRRRAAPRRPAARQTAYDLGRGSDAPPPEFIANDPDLLAAWDEGFTAREDATAAPPPRRRTPKARPAQPSPPASDASGPGRARRVLGRLGQASGSAADDVGGAFLGLLAYALALNYLRGGWSGAPRVDSDGVPRVYGVGPWLAAKFTNTVPTAPPTAPPAASQPPLARA